MLIVPLSTKLCFGDNICTGSYGVDFSPGKELVIVNYNDECVQEIQSL